MRELQETLSMTNPEDDMFDDEIDELFGQLEQIQPPESLVGQILAAVAQLPPYPHIQSALVIGEAEELEELAVYGE